MNLTSLYPIVCPPPAPDIWQASQVKHLQTWVPCLFLQNQSCRLPHGNLSLQWSRISTLLSPLILYSHIHSINKSGLPSEFSHNLTLLTFIALSPQIPSSLTCVITMTTFLVAQWLRTLCFYPHPLPSTLKGAARVVLSKPHSMSFLHLKPSISSSFLSV